KNKDGQYAHQSCARQRHEQTTDRQSRETSARMEQHDPDQQTSLDDGLGDRLGDGLGADILLADLPAEQEAVTPGGLRQGCPGCGGSLTDGTVVCMSCGFDTRSGKAMKTKVGKIREPGSGIGAATAGVGSAAATNLGYLAGSMIGAAIAASLGALLWAGLIVGIEREMGWVAIIIGVLSGFGAVMGARGESGMMTGVIACVICLAAICAGKYYGVKHLADTYIENIQSEETTFYADMDKVEREQYAMAVYVDDILQERLDAGGLDTETADSYENLILEGYFPTDYPKDVVNESRRRWRTQGEQAQLAFFDKIQAEFDTEFDAFVEAERENIYEQGFIATFGFADILFFGFALCAAFGTGTGAGMD
ncbi:MAG: hypothetical protein AAGA55_08680, partial [Planctomycetota bacterium]